MNHPVVYEPYEGDELWWCNNHQRKATYIRTINNKIEHVCRPGQGGILLPCFAVNLTNIVEIEDEKSR